TNSSGSSGGGSNQISPMRRPTGEWNGAGSLSLPQGFSTSRVGRLPFTSPPLLVCRAGELADLLHAMRRSDHHVVAVDHDDHVLQPDDGNLRTVGIDQHVAAIDQLGLAAHAIA